MAAARGSHSDRLSEDVAVDTTVDSDALAIVGLRLEVEVTRYSCQCHDAFDAQHGTLWVFLPSES